MTIMHTLRLIIIAFLCMPSFVLASSIGNLFVEKDGKSIAQGVATIIASDRVVTSYNLVNLGDRWLVQDHTGAKLVAELIAESPEHDLALLETRGLRGEPVVLAETIPERGRTVSTMVSTRAISRGIITSRGSGEQIFFEHTALYTDNTHGSPVFNNCEELVGISNTSIEGIFKRRPAEPALPLRSTSIDGLLPLLKSNNVEPNVSGSECLSMEAQLEKAQNRTQQTNQERQEADRLLEEIRQRNEELKRTQAEIQATLSEREDELNHTAEEKADLEELAATIRAESEVLRERQAKLALEKEKQEKEFAEEEEKRQQQLQFLLVGIAILLMVLLAVVVILRRRRQMLDLEKRKSGKIEKALSRATVTFPDILLSGSDHNGDPIRVKINGTALIRSEEGQILGREAAEVDYVLNPLEISRQHIRLLVINNTLTAIDLNSNNGTAINDEVLTPGREYALGDGDMLSLASIELSVHLIKG